MNRGVIGTGYSGQGQGGNLGAVYTGNQANPVNPLGHMMMGRGQFGGAGQFEPPAMPPPPQPGHQGEMQMPQMYVGGHGDFQVQQDQYPPGSYSGHVTAEQEKKINEDVEMTVDKKYRNMSQSVRELLQNKLAQERNDALKQNPHLVMETGKKQESNRDAEKYGILGLLKVQPDLNMLALGVDLTKLGLDLTYNGFLSHSLVSPFSTDTQPVTLSPHADMDASTMPACYSTTIPNLEQVSHFAEFSINTLFYIFYFMPADRLQALAAQELARKGWEYQVDSMGWYRRIDVPRDDPRAHLNGRLWLYFDVAAWKQELCVGDMDVSRFMPQSDYVVRDGPLAG